MRMTTSIRTRIVGSIGSREELLGFNGEGFLYNHFGIRRG